MEVIKSWALSVTAAAIISAVISFVSPTGTLEKTVNTVIAIFVLLSFLTPFVKIDRNELFSVEVEHINEWIEENKLKKELEFETISILKNEIITKVNSYINEKMKSKSEVDVEINISENYDIVIDKIGIILYEQTDVSDLTRYIEDEFKVIPQINIMAED